MVCFDTTFLIDLMREAGRGQGGPATEKLRELQERKEVPRTTMITVGELYVGPYRVRDTEAELRRLDDIIAELEVLDLTIGSARRFGKLVAELHERGTPIGVVDSLIAGIVLESDELLITRDTADFDKVPGLQVSSY